MKKSAFTLIEVAFAMTLFVCVAALLLVYQQTGPLRTDLNTQTALLVEELRLAQNAAQSGKSSAYGIHFESDSYVRFEGSNYDPAEPSNNLHTLPANLEIASVSLAGAASGVIFNSPNGNTAQSGSIEIRSVNLNESLILTVTPTGHVSY